MERINRRNLEQLPTQAELRQKRRMKALEEKRADWRNATDLLYDAIEYYEKKHPDNKINFNNLETIRTAVSFYHDAGLISVPAHEYMNMINARINKCIPGGKKTFILNELILKKIEIEKQIAIYEQKANSAAEGQKFVCFWCGRPYDELNTLETHKCHPEPLEDIENPIPEANEQVGDDLKPEPKPQKLSDADILKMKEITEKKAEIAKQKAENAGKAIENYVDSGIDLEKAEKEKAESDEFIAQVKAEREAEQKQVDYGAVEKAQLEKERAELEAEKQRIADLKTQLEAEKAEAEKLKAEQEVIEEAIEVIEEKADEIVEEIVEEIVLEDTETATETEERFESEPQKFDNGSLETLTVRQLKTLANKLGIPHASNILKADLIALINKNGE